MQFIPQQTTSNQFIVQPVTQLDQLTQRQLQRLGIRPGTCFTVIRQYPLHGPVIIQLDQQRIAIRYPIFQALVGGA